MNRFLAIFLTAFSALAADFPGRYVLAGVPEVASELVLKADGSFEYLFIYGAADFQAKGAWRQDGNTVFLTTSEPTAPPLKLVHSGTGAASEVRVRVKTPNGRGIPQIDVVLKTPAGEVVERTGGDGAARFSEVRTAQSVRFRIGVYDFESEVFPLSAGDNDFSFEINAEAITRVPFQAERLVLVDGGLEMRFWNRDRPMKYRRK